MKMTSVKQNLSLVLKFKLHTDPTKLAAQSKVNELENMINALPADEDDVTFSSISALIQYKTRKLVKRARVLLRKKVMPPKLHIFIAVRNLYVFSAEI